MYYSNGNYHAFAHPKKPKGVEDKSAYLIGSGLASLAAAVFLIRDGQMPGKNIHILEELSLPGGSLDATLQPENGFVMRGGREMEEHFETLWDLFRSIPSLDTKNATVLDEFFWLAKEDPSFSHARIIENNGTRMATDGQLKLSKQDIREILSLVLMTEEELNDTKINDIFSPEFFESNFWLYWASMFAFEPWASAMEMRRYLLRFVHHVGALADMSSLRFTKYNQYESLVKPLIHYLEEHHVHFQYNTAVKNVIVKKDEDKKIATSLELVVDGIEKNISLTENDLIFVTNGSITESTTYGSNHKPADTNHELGASWALWKALARQDSDFGKPEKFCDNIPKENWVISGTITLKDDRVLPYIENISKKDPRSGSIVTSGPVTIKDSSWFYGYSISRQPVYKAQNPNETVVWVYGLFSDKKGDFVKKKITECTGIELCEEWLYHIGVPISEIHDIATNSANTIPSHMPYITSYFMPRAVGDRPLVVPKGSQNLAFIGNFAETDRDTVFTTEYSVRTAMEAVYTLLEIDRGVPEVFASSFDVRTILETLYYLNDQKGLNEVNMPLIDHLIEKEALKKIRGSYIEELLENANLI
ncbi:oleate hydratase [Enterococcus sp. DIV0421]|uniref:oleate hydratase n=1 Tax=Enterococcus TaxID=1350 RepID=UPI000A355F43|nr:MULTISPECIES: oleate hydratase [Enterococcus]OTO01175.1 myosin-cross-reactive antigen like family protein [Enterococcus sp. 5B3_DIV0040]